MEKLFLIDAYALIFRFYYAFIARPMRNKAGLNTSAIYGFTRFIEDIICNEKPHHIGVAFDPKGGTFRHEIFESYKAQRPKTPEDIIASVPYIKSILEAMRIPILEIPGYEADDVIGTIAKMAAADNYDVYMVTPDKDYGQLVEDNISIYKPRKGGFGVEVIRKADILNKYKIDTPIKVTDILALWGDSADNVPGVPGIGEKTAIKLVSELGSIEEILNNTDKLKGKQKESVESSREALLLAKKLVTIDINVPIDYCPERLVIEYPDINKLVEIYGELDFHTFIRDLKIGRCAASLLLDSGSGSKRNFSMPTDSDQTSDSDFGDGLFAPLSQDVKSSEVDIKQGEKPHVLSLFDVEDDSVSQHSSITTQPHTYTIVDSNNVDKLVGLLSMQQQFCFDTETTSLDAMSCELVGISFCWEEGKAYYFPYSDTEEHRNNLNKLKPFFEDSNISKIGQNIKYDIIVLSHYDIKVQGVLYDTMIMHYLINSDERHSMDYLSEKYLKYTPIPITSLIGSGAKQLSMRDIAIERVAEYASEDADVTYRLYNILWRELCDNGINELYLKIEEPVILTLVDMEVCGVKIDKDILHNYSLELEDKLQDLELRIKSLADDPTININSPKQLGELLFVKLKVVDKPKTTKTKQYKTDEETLASIADRHEIIPIILEYRGLKKLLSTYVSALPKLINENTGRIHTSYNQAVTTTGRLSSTNPNLQNIPIRYESGKLIRKAFVAREGYKLISADYSQVELRIMAHLSKDKAMIEAFNSGEDIHTSTASKIFKVDINDVTPEMRRQAKSANFGIIYGISAFGLSENLKISRKEAKELIDGYFESYPEVKEYMDLSVSKAREQGYAETLYGRRRQLQDILSGNKIVQSYAERNAINAPIQGTAADIMKLAMSNLHDAITKKGAQANIILQVHDELVIEVLESEAKEVAELTKEIMESAAELSVPLSVEYGIADNWLDAH